MNASNVDILLVEDDARLAELTATYLGQNGLRVCVEGRGDRALHRFAQERPRLVLLDLLLPGLDGLSICREMRRTHDVPILILTAKDTEFDHVIGLESGADAPARIYAARDRRGPRRTRAIRSARGR